MTEIPYLGLRSHQPLVPQRGCTSNNYLTLHRPYRPTVPGRVRHKKGKQKAQSSKMTPQHLKTTVRQQRAKIPGPRSVATSAPQPRDVWGTSPLWQIEELCLKTEWWLKSPLADQKGGALVVVVQRSHSAPEEKHRRKPLCVQDRTQLHLPMQTPI